MSFNLNKHIHQIINGVIYQMITTTYGDKSKHRSTTILGFNFIHGALRERDEDTSTSVSTLSLHSYNHCVFDGLHMGLAKSKNTPMLSRILGKVVVEEEVTKTSSRYYNGEEYTVEEADRYKRFDSPILPFKYLEFETAYAYTGKRPAIPLFFIKGELVGYIAIIKKSIELNNMLVDLVEHVKETQPDGK